METFYHNFVGPFIFFSLITLIALAFILPKTKLAKHFKINETYFITTQVCGIICGAAGLIALFSFSPDVVRSYLWKIIIMPYVYLQIYIVYVMLAVGTFNILDEKQDFNMSSASGITLGTTILIMGFIVDPLIKNGGFEIKLLFPFYMYSVILIFSLITLLLFKKA